jgi:Ca2+-binding RTX toxin-like protein
MTGRVHSRSLTAPPGRWLGRVTRKRPPGSQALTLPRALRRVYLRSVVPWRRRGTRGSREPKRQEEDVREGGHASGRSLSPSSLSVAGVLLGFILGSLFILTNAADAGGCTNRSLTRGGGDNDFTDDPGFSTNIDMGGGDDLAEMGNCHDTAFGDTGFDELHGALGNDDVFGQANNDQPSSCDPSFNCGGLFGGDGTDLIEGGTGQDDLDDSQAGGDNDTLRGQDGNDVLNARDGDGSDTLNGGNGSDNCTNDAGDSVTACA